MANTVIVYSHLNEQIQACINEGKSFTVMGEIIMFVSAVNGLKKAGFNVRFANNRAEFQKLDVRGVVYYILDYLSIDTIADIVTRPDKKHRIRFFCYWGRNTAAEIPWGFSPAQVCIPFPYHDKPNNKFLGFVMPDIKAGSGSGDLDKTITGYIWGKEHKYFNPGVVNSLGDAGIQLYATCTQPISYKNVTNLGLLPREAYLDVLRHVKYVIGFGDPIAGPTIVETLELGKILIAPRKQVPAFLHYHPNVVLSDDLGADGIIRVIRDIEAGHKYVGSDGVDEFHEASYLARLGAIFPKLPERRTCIVHCTMKDNNIFHFLAIEMKTLWEFIARNTRVDYHVVIDNYDGGSAAHKWRRAMIAAMCTRVYCGKDGISGTAFDNAILELDLRYNGTFFEHAKFIKYPLDKTLASMADHIKNYYLGNDYVRCPTKLLLIQRRGTRRLVDTRGVALEESLGAACAARGIPFQCSFFEDISFEEQVRVISSAKWIVAAHGAAETNLIFANPDATLIEVNMRTYWYCDPVCKRHMDGTLSFSAKCKCERIHADYHKADYHNLAYLCGLQYREVSPVDYGGRFVDSNPISRETIIVRCSDIEAAMQE